MAWIWARTVGAVGLDGQNRRGNQGIIGTGDGCLRTCPLDAKSAPRYEDTGAIGAAVPGWEPLAHRRRSARRQRSAFSEPPGRRQLGRGDGPERRTVRRRS